MSLRPHARQRRSPDSRYRRYEIGPGWRRAWRTRLACTRSQESGAPPSEDVELLGQLAGLHATGALTDEEFAAKKVELLARM